MPPPPNTSGVVAPPPFIFFGIEALALVIDWFVPFPFLPDSVSLIAGIVFVVIGLVVGFWAFAAMRNAHTPVDPYEPSTAIVTDGPYRFTRNPIYVAFTSIYLGFACLFNALGPLIFLPLVLAIIDRWVILREEHYLEAKFGPVYTDYKAKVRRWL